MSHRRHVAPERCPMAAEIWRDAGLVKDHESLKRKREARGDAEPETEFLREREKIIKTMLSQDAAAAASMLGGSPPPVLTFQ